MSSKRITFVLSAFMLGGITVKGMKGENTPFRAEIYWMIIAYMQALSRQPESVSLCRTLCCCKETGAEKSVCISAHFLIWVKVARRCACALSSLHDSQSFQGDRMKVLWIGLGRGCPSVKTGLSIRAEQSKAAWRTSTLG